LLGRVFNILRENNPKLAGDRRRTVMRPPQVLREGTKKTVFVNFMDLCRTMHRPHEHVMAFLLAELGTSGSTDGQNRLVVKGRFAPKNFEGILRRYVNEYVICLGCKSPDTILSKENRLFFVRCEKCRSNRSVAPIKAGFVACVAVGMQGHDLACCPYPSWILIVQRGGDSLYKTGPDEMPAKLPSAPASLTRLKRRSSQANQPRPDLDYQNSTVN
ncbi:eukaryotic translation initiation factor 2 subunit beta, partial [Quercus suber]